MPTADDLGKLATELYKEHPSVGAYQSIYSGLTLDRTKASSLGFTRKQFYVWSGEEYGSHYAYYRNFYSSGARWSDSDRDSNNKQAVCLGE